MGTNGTPCGLGRGLRRPVTCDCNVCNPAVAREEAKFDAYWVRRREIAARVAPLRDGLQVVKTAQVGRLGPASQGPATVYAVKTTNGWIRVQPWSDFVGENGRDGVAVFAGVEAERPEGTVTKLKPFWADLVVSALVQRDHEPVALD